MKTLMIVALVLGQYSTDGPSQWDFTAPQEVAVEERKPAWPTWVAASKSGKPVVLFVNVEPGGWHRGDWDATIYVEAVFQTMGNCIRARDRRAEPMSYGECEWVGAR